MQIAATIRITIIILATLALAILSISQAVGSIAKRQNPMLGLSTVPANGMAFANAAGSLLKMNVIQNEGKVPDKFDPKLVRWAIEGFRLEPTASTAVRIIAMDKAAGGDQESARNIMRFVPQLTKRDAVANFWLVEDFSKSGNIDKVLHYYDLTLRSSDASRAVIMPVLTNALANEEFVKPLATLLVKRPLWAPEFWQRLVRTRPALVNAAKLRISLADQGIAIARDNEQFLLSQLVKVREYDAAYGLYSSLAGEERADAGAIGAVVSKAVYPPFDWELRSDGDFNAYMSGDSESLSVTAARGADSVIARQLVRLPKGQYTAIVELTEPIGSEADMWLSLRCAEPIQRQFIRLSLKARRNSETFSLSGADCEYYWYEIEMRAFEEIPAGQIELRSIKISPAAL